MTTSHNITVYIAMQWVTLFFFVWLSIMASYYYFKARSRFRLLVMGTIISWTIVNIAFYILVITSREYLSDDFTQSFSALTKIQAIIIILAVLRRLDKER